MLVTLTSELLDAATSGKKMSGSCPLLDTEAEEYRRVSRTPSVAGGVNRLRIQSRLGHRFRPANGGSGPQINNVNAKG